MKLIFIRHGDPDYAHDALTEKGQREAELLAGRVLGLNADYYYLSPLGRAQATAEASLKRFENRDELKVETLPWLREFAPTIIRPDRAERAGVCWDWMPEDWTKIDSFYDYDKWTEHPIFQEAGVGEEVKYIYEEFEKLLNKHGYYSEGRYFRAERPNGDTLVFFCHFGITMVLLSYLFKISPMVLWQNFISTTTSVTTVVTEERRPGKASFRMTSFSDASHLTAGGEPISFSGRFCEMYTNADERH